MTSPTPVVYVFHGQDEPQLRERLATFCAAVNEGDTADLNTARLAGDTVQLGEIEMAVGTLPFLADHRLTLVENLTESGNARALLDGLPDLFAGMPDWSRLVFVETGLYDPGGDASQTERKRVSSRRQTLKKLVNLVENDPRGKVEAFEPPQDMARWLAERAARHGSEIEREAAALLAERIGSNLMLADAELVKLATYAGGERPIQAGDVELLTPYSPEANVFHMVDALSQRDGSRALSLLRRLLDDGDEPLRIFGMIVRQYRLLIQMREYLDEGGPLNAASQALDMHKYVAQKMAGQARRYSLPTLEKIYRHLLDVDEAVKTGQQEPELALETLVTELAGRG
ncbi:MAG: DNA polymerase III subunit delta [Chloroflexota bacterium]